MKNPNKYGCIPNEDVCLKHSEPLIFKNGCSMANNLYRCKYYSGGDTEYDGGVWTKKETEKTIIFTQIEESFYQPNWTVLKIIKDEKRNKRHCLKDWGDNTYTIYPDQCGNPHVFKPLTLFDTAKVLQN
jgi:hypothetical protein